MRTLAEYRREAGFRTQEALSNATGFKRVNICKWETGRMYPRIHDIPKLAQALNVTEGEIIAAVTASKQDSA